MPLLLPLLTFGSLLRRDFSATAPAGIADPQGLSRIGVTCSDLAPLSSAFDLVGRRSGPGCHSGAETCTNMQLYITVELI